MVLSPVGKDGAISTIGNQLFRELSHFRIEVVHDVMNNARCLWGLSRIHMLGIGHYPVRWPEAVHIDVPVISQLGRKLRAKDSMKLIREIPQGISDGLYCFFGCQSGSTNRGVRHVR